MSKLREEFDRNHAELSAKYDQRLQELKDDLELRRKVGKRGIFLCTAVTVLWE